MARLIDITGKALSGEWGNDDTDGTGIPVLRTTNFTNDGIVNYEAVVTRSITKKDLTQKFLRNGDIIIEKSGGSDKQPVGRVIYFDGPEETYLFNNFTGVLRIKDRNRWHPRYVFYSLYANYQQGGTRRYENRTTGLHNLQTDQYVSELEIAEVSLQQQQVCISILDYVSRLINLRKQQIAKLDELVKARFVEMFGDCTNIVLLSDVAEVSGGLTKNSKRDSLPLHMPYLRVANVSFATVDVTEMLEIGLTEDEYEKTRLCDGDLLFVEGNGSPDQIGRVAVWHNEISPCVHQNHLIKARFRHNEVLPVYAMHYFMTQQGRMQIKSKAVSTSGLYTLSVTKIESLELPKPSLELQHQFAAFVAQTDQQKLTIQHSLAKLELLKKALMQKYFG